MELVLETSKPAFLESIKLPIFSLGTTGPSFSNAHVYPGLEPDLIHLDLDLTFEPQMADDNQTIVSLKGQLTALTKTRSKNVELQEQLTSK